jgi:hypothetical protein
MLPDISRKLGLRENPLTPPRTASCPHATVRLFHIRNRTVMRWHGGFGSVSLRDCSLTLCHRSFVPATSASTPHSSSFFEIYHFVPSASACTPYLRSPSPWRSSGVGVVVVAGFFWWGFVFLSSFFIRPFKSSSCFSFRVEPNASAHRERPKGVPSSLR